MASVSCSFAAHLIASHANSYRDSSRVPPPRASAETSRNLRRPITTDFQILEVLFRPSEILHTVTARKWSSCDRSCYQQESGAYKFHALACMLAALDSISTCSTSVDLI